LTTFTDHRHTGQACRPVTNCPSNCSERRPQRDPYRGLTEKVLDSLHLLPLVNRPEHRCPGRPLASAGGESCNTQKNLERQNYSLVKELYAKPITSRTTHFVLRRTQASQPIDYGGGLVRVRPFPTSVVLGTASPAERQ
jgi:hypothetical protein